MPPSSATNPSTLDSATPTAFDSLKRLIEHGADITRTQSPQQSGAWFIRNITLKTGGIQIDMQTFRPGAVVGDMALSSYTQFSSVCTSESKVMRWLDERSGLFASAEQRKALLANELWSSWSQQSNEPTECALAGLRFNLDSSSAHFTKLSISEEIQHKPILRLVMEQLLENHQIQTDSVTVLQTAPGKGHLNKLAFKLTCFSLPDSTEASTPKLYLVDELDEVSEKICRDYVYPRRDDFRAALQATSSPIDVCGEDKANSWKGKGGASWSGEFARITLEEDSNNTGADGKFSLVLSLMGYTNKSRKSKAEDALKAKDKESQTGD